MTKRLDTMTTLLAMVDSTVATYPTIPAMENMVLLINASYPDRSHRVS